jgi:hypothetical protein
MTMWRTRSTAWKTTCPNWRNRSPRCKAAVSQIQDTIKGDVTGGLKDEFDRLNFRVDQLSDQSEKAFEAIDELKPKVAAVEAAAAASDNNARFERIERVVRDDVVEMLNATPAFFVAGPSAFKITISSPGWWLRHPPGIADHTKSRRRWPSGPTPVVMAVPGLDPGITRPSAVALV